MVSANSKHGGKNSSVIQQNQALIPILVSPVPWSFEISISNTQKRRKVDYGPFILLLGGLKLKYYIIRNSQKGKLNQKKQSFLCFSYSSSSSSSASSSSSSSPSFRISQNKGFIPQSLQRERDAGGAIRAGVHGGCGVPPRSQFLLPRTLPTPRHSIPQLLGLCRLVDIDSFGKRKEKGKRDSLASMEERLGPPH
ncbi:uncharacterized protein LOC116204316 [Punica granatum]|uniref:Uncharacterized protein LOC116204316 n=1 Tax=Punica granatum TaxID=22663 RepID=A0A6P8D6Q9_PUNGR|nr:uncharacterized protein LOC116204316 [Punica granatum]